MDTISHLDPRLLSGDQLEALILTCCANGKLYENDAKQLFQHIAVLTEALGAARDELLRCHADMSKAASTLRYYEEQERESERAAAREAARQDDGPG